MGGKQRRTAQQTVSVPKQGAQQAPGTDAVDPHASTSTSTATRPSVLELAARAWDESVAKSWEAATEWAQAADAVETPDPPAFLHHQVGAEFALQRADERSIEARAHAMGTDASALGWKELESKAALGAMRVRWNLTAERTHLGPPWSMPATGLTPAGTLPFVDTTGDAVWHLLNEARWVRERAASVPAERPESLELNRRRMWKQSPAWTAIAPVDLTLRKYYGHEWKYLHAQAVAGGLPAWAVEALATDAGAADYEAHLQDQGRLEVDPAKIERLAHSLRRAVEGHGTTESSIHNAEIRNLTRPEIDALEAHYQVRYDDHLTIDLDQDLSGEDDTEAFASLGGDPVRAAIEALENRMDGKACDPDDIVAVLRAIPPSERARFQELRKTDPHLQELERRILSAAYLDNGHAWRDADRDDKAWLAAWFGADVAVAEALTLELSATDAAFIDQADPIRFPTKVQVGDAEVVKADIKRLVAELEKSGDRKALEAAFDRKHEYKLRAWISASADGGWRDLALALLDGDREAETAARVKVGDHKALRKALYDPDLESKDPVAKELAVARREKVNRVYRERYGQLGDTDQTAVANDICRRYDDDERAQALYVLDRGKESVAIGTWLAIYEAGTKEGWLKDLFRGKTKAEMAEARREYAAYTGRDFDADLADELSGDEKFDIEMLARGVPESPDEALQYAKERNDRYRSGGTWQDVTDGVEYWLFWSDSGGDADHQYKMLRGMYGPDGKLLPGADPRQAIAIQRWHATAIADHQVAKKMVVEAIARGVEILVSALATVLTAGAAAPWLVRAIGAAVGAAAYVATKTVLSGSSVTADTIAVDTVVGLASAAMVGLAQAKLVAGGAQAAHGVKVLAVMGDDAAKIGGAALRERVIREAVIQLVERGSVGALQKALTDGTWDKGLDAGFLAILGAALRETGMGIASESLGRIAPEHLRTRVGQFLVETGTTWIVQDPSETERVAFVIHAVLKAGAAATTWANEPVAGERARRRAERAQQQADALGADARRKVAEAQQAALDRALADPNLSEDTKSRLRAWAARHDAKDLAFDVRAGTAGDDALTRPPVPRSSAPGAPGTDATGKPWQLRHTGQQVLHEGHRWYVLSNEDDHFVLVRQNADGQLVRALVDSQALLKNPVNGHVVDHLPEESVAMALDTTDRKGADRLYENMIADDATREAAVFWNTDTGEFIVVQGEKDAVGVSGGQVPAPAGRDQAWKRDILPQDRGFWTLVKHYHPVHSPTDPKMSRLMRFPSDGHGDMGVIHWIAVSTGEITTSAIDTLAPWGRTRTTYGYDPHTGRYFVDWEESQGQRQRQDFSDMAAYHAFLGRQGGALNPVPQLPTPTQTVPAPKSQAVEALLDDRGRFRDAVLEDAYQQYGGGLDRPTWARYTTNGRAAAVLNRSLPEGWRRSAEAAAPIPLSRFVRPDDLSQREEARLLRLLEGHPALWNGLARLDEDPLANGEVSLGRFLRLKGNVGEILAEPVKQERLRDLRQEDRGARIERGAWMWIPDASGVLQKRMFSDDLVVTARGRDLQVLGLFEVKSGSDGQRDALEQVFTWGELRLDAGVVLELANGRRWQYRPDDAPVSTGIPAGHPLAGDLAAGRIGRVTGLHQAPRDLVAAKGVPKPTDATGDRPGTKTEAHDLPVSAAAVSWLARRLLERRGTGRGR